MELGPLLGLVGLVLAPDRSEPDTSAIRVPA
jgi:hypothetical protein